MKHYYLDEVGIKNIAKKEFISKVDVTTLDAILNGQYKEIDLYKLKDLGINTVQALVLLTLKEKTGHSLFDDVLTLRRTHELNDNQTLIILSSILEIYKARFLRDIGEKYIIKEPSRFFGLKLAFDIAKSKLP